MVGLCRCCACYIYPRFDVELSHDVNLRLSDNRLLKLLKGQCVQGSFSPHIRKGLGTRLFCVVHLLVSKFV